MLVKTHPRSWRTESAKPDGARAYPGSRHEAVLQDDAARQYLM
jgi:hypothetical protein